MKSLLTRTLLIAALFLTGLRASAATLGQADQGFLNGIFHDDYIGADRILNDTYTDASIFYYTGMQGGFWLAKMYPYGFTSSADLADALRATAAVWADWATMETEPLLVKYDEGRVTAFNYAAYQVEFYFGP